MTKQEFRRIAELPGCPWQIARHMDQYLLTLDFERSLSQNTRDNYGRDLQAFALWLGGRGVETPDQLSPDLIVQFLQEQKQGLPLPGGPDGGEDRPLQPRAPSTIARRMSAIRGFCRFLTGSGVLSRDPSHQLRAPRGERPWPDAVSQSQIMRLLDLPDLGRALGRRDKALLEICYGCGLRVSELVGLSLHDIDPRQALLRVLGKGNKERIIPVGEYALQALQLYLEDGREQLSRGRGGQQLFLNGCNGGPLTRSGFFRVLRAYGRQIGLKDIHPHALRHSAATHMLQNGADLRVVQEFLGHADVSTTQIYIKLESSELKAVYNRYHPRSGYGKGEDLT